MALTRFSLRLTVLIFPVLLGGCVNLPEAGARAGDVADLIDGKAAFGHTVEPAPTQDLLDVTPEMKAFIAEGIASGQLGYSRFRRLMAKMVDSGFFVNQYDRSATYSAAETFRTRKGNCIAYTNMFIALAREAGLDASYQLMLIQPEWDVEGGYLVRNNHVNVYLEGMRVPGYSSSDVTVDFNLIQPDDKDRSKRISDEFAASMFYGNLGIQQLHTRNFEAAFAYIKRAILTDASNIDVWNNLGALYSIMGRDALAERAYLHTRSMDPQDKTAISGLAKVLRKQGRLDEAAIYNRLAERYQNRNPFYHYALAEQAFRSDDYPSALIAINHAIDLKRNNARFYALRAAAAQKLGNEELVAKSVRLVRKHAKDDENLKPWITSLN